MKVRIAASDNIKSYSILINGECDFFLFVSFHDYLKECVEIKSTLVNVLDSGV